MADVKWIKITTDIFDDEKILLIESLPDAYAIITVWFKLLCLAGKQNNSGVFMLGRMPYTESMLATIFRMKEATVTMALKTFEQFGMVEIVDGVITIPNWDKHQSLDKLELAKEQTRQRVARHREKQKEMLLGAGSEKKCVYCGEKGDTIDHIIPRTKGGPDTKDNVVPCCLSCNMQKNDRDVAKFLNDRLIMNEKLDIQGICQNEILQHFVSYDVSAGRFVTPCNVTDRYNVTQCNTNVTPTDIDIEQDKEQDKDNTIIGKADGETAKVTEMDIEEEFEALWELYPRKEGKKTALATYKRVRTRKKKPVTYEQVKDGIVAYANANKKTDRKYIKQGSTWFNGECWNDEITGGTENGRTQTGRDTEKGTKPSWAGNVL